MDDSRFLPGISRRSLLGCAAASATVVAAGLPRPAFAADGEGRPLNIRVSQDGYGTHAEPCLAVNPVDPRNLLGACMVGPSTVTEFIASYASFDGGVTWRSNGALPLPAGTVSADDVTVAFDRAGRGFVCAMATSGLSRDDRGVYVWRTDDGGRSFAAPVTVMAGQFADHPWMAASRGPGPWAGNVYAVWVAADHGALGFGRSTDGGISFEAPRMIQGRADTSVSAPMVAAGPRGLVCAIYEGAPVPGGSPDADFQIEVVCSADGGQTFGPPVTLGQEASVLALPGGVAPNGGPAIAAAPRGHEIYAAFTTHQPGADHSGIVVSASYDRGRTWRPPLAATPDDHVIYFQPQLTVDNDGQVALSAFALAGGRVDVVLFTSGPGPLRFGPPLTITSKPFDPAEGTVSGGKHGTWWIGDYQGLASSPGALHPFWNDTRTGQLELFTATVNLTSGRAT
jgi:hypothetical protein